LRVVVARGQPIVVGRVCALVRAVAVIWRAERALLIRATAFRDRGAATLA